MSLGCKLGLDVNEREQGFALLDFALNFQDPGMVDFIMQLGAEPKVNCRWYAVNADVVLRLIDWGVQVPDHVRRRLRRESGEEHKGAGDHI